MILIGGQALKNLGSSRNTNDVDFLSKIEGNNNAFITSENQDILNANGNKFFSEVYESEKGNEQATPQGLMDLKCYAFVQHCQNFNFKKADDCEYDIKFLYRNFGVKPKTVVKYISSGELSEINKIINSVKF